MQYCETDLQNVNVKLGGTNIMDLFKEQEKLTTKSTNLNIRVSVKEKEFISEYCKERGYKNITSYIKALIHADINNNKK